MNSLRLGDRIRIPRIGAISTDYLPKKNKPRILALKLVKYYLPSRLFSAMWAGLCFCMGFASFIVLIEAKNKGVNAALPLGVFATHLVCNWICKLKATVSPHLHSLWAHYL